METGSSGGLACAREGEEAPLRAASAGASGGVDRGGVVVKASAVSSSNSCAACGSYPGSESSKAGKTKSGGKSVKLRDHSQ